MTNKIKRLFTRQPIRGIARNVRWKMESPEYVLTFRIQRLDSKRNKSNYVSVELRGHHITGTVTEGDDVEVVGKLTRKKIFSSKSIFNPKMIHNITTNKNVEIISSFRGIARNVEWSMDSLEFVLTLQLEREDWNGNRIDQLPVQLKAPNITGRVSNGDEVEVPGELTQGGGLSSKRIINLSTNTDVEASSVVHGIARNVTWRQDGIGQYPTTVLNLRIERINEEGNAIGYVSVEMRSTSITGQLADGDKVEITKGSDSDGIFRPKQLVNHSTNSQVSNDGIEVILPIVLSLVFLSVVIGSVVGYSTGVPGGAVAGALGGFYTSIILSGIVVLIFSLIKVLRRF